MMPPWMKRKQKIWSNEHWTRNINIAVAANNWLVFLVYGTATLATGGETCFLLVHKTHCFLFWVLCWDGLELGHGPAVSWASNTKARPDQIHPQYIRNGLSTQTSLPGLWRREGEWSRLPHVPERRSLVLWCHSRWPKFIQSHRWKGFELLHKNYTQDQWKQWKPQILCLLHYLLRAHTSTLKIVCFFSTCRIWSKWCDLDESSKNLQRKNTKLPPRYDKMHVWCFNGSETKH